MTVVRPYQQWVHRTSGQLVLVADIQEQTITLSNPRTSGPTWTMDKTAFLQAFKLRI